MLKPADALNHETSTTELSRPAIRWWPATVIVAVMIAGLCWVWFNPDNWRAMHVVGTLMTVGGGSILLFAWFLLASRISGTTRLKGTVAAIVLLGALSAAVRIDNFDGDMFPQFAWRWTPTAEERFALSKAPPDVDEDSEDDREAGTVAKPQPVLPSLGDLTGDSASDYASFLGPDRLGVLRNLSLDRDWQTRPPEDLWRRPIGLGWSAFAVAGNSAFTQEQRNLTEVVVCYDLRSGQERWVHEDNARFSEALGGDGPRATPAIHRGRVYSLGATGKFNCLDAATGKEIWSHDVLELAGAGNIVWGLCGSPLVAGGSVIVSAGVANDPAAAKGQDHSLLAFDIESGELRWHAGNQQAAYCSPQAMKLGGVEQIVIYNGPGVAGHDAATGRELWSFKWANDQMINCTQPVHLADFGEPGGQDKLLVSTGYGKGSTLLSIAREGERWDVEPLWDTLKLRSKFANMLVRDGYVYGLDEGILTCLDLKDGSQVWKKGRYGHGQMLLVDDLLLIMAEGGDLVLVQASPEAHREIARHTALTSKTWNHAAVSGDLILVRNDREAACFRLPTIAK